jgi:hypothetical protein
MPAPAKIGEETLAAHALAAEFLGALKGARLKNNHRKSQPPGLQKLHMCGPA